MKKIIILFLIILFSTTGCSYKIIKVEENKSDQQAIEEKVATTTSNVDLENDNISENDKDKEVIIKEIIKEIPIVSNIEEIQKESDEIRIEKCKAKAQLQVDQMKKEFDKLFLEYQSAFQVWEQNIKKYEVSYYDCMLESTPEELRILSPSDQRSIKEAKCDYYLGEKAKLEKELQQKKEDSNNLFQKTNDMLEQDYSGFYLECLNEST